MYKTTHNKYEVPEYLENNWHQELQTTFGLIDSDVHALKQIGADEVLVVKDGTTYEAFNAEGSMAAGSDATTVIQAAINELNQLNGGTVTCYGGVYDINSQIIVKEDVTLNTALDSLFMSQLSDGWTPTVHIKPHADSQYLFMDANQNSGVQIGDENVAVESFNGFIKVYNAGTQFDATDGSQFGVDIKGFNIAYYHIETVGGNAGIKYNGADIYGHSTLAVNGTTGLNFGGSEHVFLPSVDVDSPTYQGMSISSAADVHMTGTVWFNADVYTASPTAAVSIGQYGASKVLNLDLDIIGVGGIGLDLYDVSDSRIEAYIGNPTMATTTNTTDTGVRYDAATPDSNTVDLHLDPSLATKISGTPVGILNEAGYEAAGAGNPPTAANWDEHRMVENTDDNTIWMKTRAGTMVQLG